MLQRSPVCQIQALYFYQNFTVTRASSVTIQVRQFVKGKVSIAFEELYGDRNVLKPTNKPLK